MSSVQTVRGPVDTADLGLTLFHEHLLNDVRSWWHAPTSDDPEEWELATAPVKMSCLGRLRLDPFASRDNCVLDDIALAIDEVTRFKNAGGSTIVEQTCLGIGRDPAGLRRIAEACDVNIVMGTGYYLESSHPPEVGQMTIDQVADQITADVTKGESGIRAGVIGEIGISASFTASEEKVLRGAARAQSRMAVPLSVHLPGWERLAHRVLDVVAEEGGDIGAVVLCHMNPSQGDLHYQQSLAARGAWLSYDMIGMEYFFADQSAQSPCDEETAGAIAALVAAGWGGRLLLSGDVFVKTQLVAYGGYGYAHIPTSFAQRLRRHGLTDDAVTSLLAFNPAAVFRAAAKGNET